VAKIRKTVELLKVESIEQANIRSFEHFNKRTFKQFNIRIADSIMFLGIQQSKRALCCWK